LRGTEIVQRGSVVRVAWWTFGSKLTSAPHGLYAERLPLPAVNPQITQHIAKLLTEIAASDGSALTDRFASLRAVDAKVREAKLLLGQLQARQLVDALNADADLQVNSRRVRLEALANHLRTAQRFVSTGVLDKKKQIFRGPSLVRLTQSMPDLEPIIQARWLEAQKCQVAGAYVAAVVMMGSILEALLLARCSHSPAIAYQAKSAPKDKAGKSIAVHDWSLSALIDVCLDAGWIKSDRAGFSHALRQSRNIVHPYEHARAGANFDEATCQVCWQVLNSSVDDLLQSV
jgi:hypothetical protein